MQLRREKHWVSTLNERPAHLYNFKKGSIFIDALIFQRGFTVLVKRKYGGFKDGISRHGNETQ